MAGGDYREAAESQLLAGVTGPILTKLLEAGRQMKRTAWLRHVRNQVRLAMAPPTD
ncbi:MAG: hypothetical protein R3C14_07140 [Caldilineaceae bacterium]